MQINQKKNIALFLTGQAVSIFGSMLVQYAIVWYITLKTGSGSKMTIFILAGILPMFFISPFAGVWADKHNKKYIINIADSIIAIVSLITALLFMAGFENIWLLLCCSAIRALGQGVQTPAVTSFIPEITSAEHLTKVNGINGSIQSFIMLTAPIASAALLSFASITHIFLLDVITAAIGISIVFFFVKTPKRAGAAAATAGTATSAGAGVGAAATPAAGKTQDGKPSSYFYDIKQGLSYIAKNKFILSLIIISVIFFIVVSPTAFLTPLQVTRNFGDDIWRLSAIEICFSFGMMAGGILISLWGGFKNRVVSMALACALFGIEAVALGITGNFLVYLAIMAFMGFTMPIYNTPCMVMLQTKVAPPFMGRVMSVFNMVSSLMMPAGMLLFGPLSDIVSINLLLVVTGIILFLLAVPFLASRSLLEAGRTN